MVYRFFEQVPRYNEVFYRCYEMVSRLFEKVLRYNEKVSSLLRDGFAFIREYLFK